MTSPQPLHLTVKRLLDTGKETFGTLTINGGGHPVIHTLEDTWKNNAQNISCIPAGTYTCVPHGWDPKSRVKFKQVWRLLNTAPREAILIHAGNTHLDTHGCILVGFVRRPGSILQSRDALNFLRNTIGQRSFTLTIEG